MNNSHPTTQLSDLIRSHSSISNNIFSDESTVVFTNKARGAIYKSLISLDNNLGDTILIPAFHCPTVVQPVLLAGYKVRFYQINRDLSININDLSRLLDKDVAAVIVINYFGFNQDIIKISEICHTNNSIVIEDCSHSFIRANPLELTGSTGDISIYSFWKLVPSYTGGGIRINNRNLKIDIPTGYKLSFKRKLIITKHIFEQILENCSDKNLLKRILLYLERQRVKNKKNNSANNDADRETDINKSYPFIPDYYSDSIPSISLRILKNADIESITNKRRHNYNLLTNSFPETNLITPVFHTLSDRTCPWAYPVLIENRNSIDFKLKNLGIKFFTFGELLHPIMKETISTSNEALEDAEYLSRSLLCYSIHQNLSDEDIYNACNKTKSFLEQEI